MKTSRYIIAAAVLLAASCSKEIEQQGTELTITASFAENQTKTTLQDGGTTVYWEPGDEVKLFYDGTGGRFSNQYSELSGTAKFSGSLNVVFLSNEGFSDSTPLWGLYPYRANATADNSSVTTTLPSEQTGKAGSFAKGMNLSIGKSTSLSMGFYNVCGGVRFSVTRSDVKNVVFEALSGESVAGKVKLAFEGGVPVVKSVSDGKTSITLTAPSGGAFETGKWYYIVALPGTLSGGFKMTFNTDTKYAVLKSTDSRTITRSKFGSLADADDGLVYKDKETPGPSGDNIVFKDIVAKVACLEKFDTNKDDEISFAEAAAVTSIAGLFTDYNTVTSFDELKYFTGIKNLSLALIGLKGLKSTTIPAGVTSVENYAFDGCSALESVTFAGSAVKTIGHYAFRSCTALAEITLPSSVESIGQNSFQGCSTLEVVGLPSGLTGIGAYSFSDCTELVSIEFPSTLNTIGNYAFQNCKSIKSASVPNTVTSFGSNVFNGCTSLETATLPSGLTSIPNGTFSGCNFLCHFTFPESVTTIGDDAFRNCSFFDKSTSVAKIELPSTVTTIGSRVFNKARNVLITSSTLVSIQSNTFSVCTRIFVPDAKVELYKVKTNWSNFARYIFPTSSYTDEPFKMESVDLGLSVKWATCNVGAFKPEECGYYFAWGDVVGQLWEYGWSGEGFSTYPAYELDYNNKLKPEYDAANVNLGGSWRMPTIWEQQELITNCTSAWTSNYEDTGVAGRIFTSRKEGYTNKSIFLPAAGYGSDNDLNYAGSIGLYWSNSFYSDYTRYLHFSSDGVDPDFRILRKCGFSVRPVTE